MELLGKKHIGSLGRIVIPSEIRNRWGLKPNTIIEIHLNGDFLILKKAGEQCALCGKPITNDDCVKFNKFFDQKIVILCHSCYGFLWKEFKKDETKEKIQMNVEKEEPDNERETD